jgi:hypothetical protein
MGKATKQKAKAAPIYAANDPTPERMRRDDFAVIPAPRMEDEHLGRDRLASTRKQACRVRRMEASGWLTRPEAVALERYELLTEQCGYGHTRSCMDMSPRGGGGPEAAIDRTAAARQFHARCCNAVKAQGRDMQVALIFVDAVLAPYGGETVEDVTDRLIGGTRATRRDTARGYVASVAAALDVYYNA